ncbi:MAG: hypothetical protein H6739_04655 [Alphaproteobacteria bacterium]|nr:hypothetical protein [Alphaproteobacteria bacterium]
MSLWQQVKAGWSEGWSALEAQGQQLYAAAIQADPSAYSATVQGFIEALTGARGHLDRQRDALAQLPEGPERQAAVARYQAQEERYHTLAAGLYSDAAPASEAMGLVPVLVVGGLALGIAGTAWAVAAYEYAVNLREQTALADRELTARVQASQEGRTLQPTTLPQPPEDVGGGGLMLLAGALALGVGGFFMLRGRI